DLTGGAARWSLDASAGTQASLAWEGDAAVLRVERAAPRDDGTWFVNLDTTLPVPTLADYGEVSFRVQGEGLGHVRVYLESADERWRSPPVPVTPSDTLHTVPFDAFEHQLREDGRWRVVGWTHPGRVPTLSFKVGHYVNPPEQAGSVRLDDVGLR
ncbi:MAG TPA: hypothetical protein PKA64_16770, partial [Myxococcota bacterium]|nr:hypothetical protein [Myxococcota bacterium]